jgi:5-methylthioadenosine/S-adenosylhomocysteine deaminase
MNTPNQADLIIDARWIIPVQPANTTLEHHSVVVKAGLIADILPTREAHERYRADNIRSLSEHVLIPGLVNAHTHAAMSLMRGFADDQSFTRWLKESIWPAEQRLMSKQFVYDGTFLAAAEMLKGGITCCNDMYFFPEESARAFTDIGMRAMIGIVVFDAPGNYASNADDYLHKGLKARDLWHHHPLLGFNLAPHSAYAVSDKNLEQIATFAEELDLGIHIHAYETLQEITESLSQYGARPLQRLDALGLVGPGLQIAHGIFLNDHEQKLLAQRNCAVIHNPTSNMKLASGIAPVTTLQENGITVALGTDGAASNNRMDILREMRQAALLAKVSTGNAEALPAHRVIRMATLDGATALGLQDRIGRILPGMEADLCAISLASPYDNPCYDPASHLVYVTSRESVTDVWVHGESRVQEGSLLRTGNKELLQISRMWQNTAKPW